MKTWLVLTAFALASPARAQHPLLACPPALLSPTARFFSASPDDLTHAYRLLLEHVHALPDGADRLRRMYTANALFSLGIVTDSAQIPLVDGLEQLRRYVDSRADAEQTRGRLTKVLEALVPEAERTESRGRAAFIREAQMPDQVWRERLFQSEIRAVALSDNGQLVAAHSYTEAHVFDRSTDLVHRFPKPAGEFIGAMAISGSGQAIALASTKGVKVFRWEAGVGPSPVHAQTVALQRDVTGLPVQEQSFAHPKELIFAADGAEVFVVAHRTMERWDARSGAKIEDVSFPSRLDYISDAAVSPNGERIAVNLGAEGLIVLVKGRKPWHVPLTAIHRSYLRFSEDGSKLLAMGFYNGFHLTVLNLESPLRDNPPLSLPYYDRVAVSGDLTKLLTHRTPTVEIAERAKGAWDLSSRKLGNFIDVKALGLSADGAVAAVGEGDGTLRAVPIDD